MTTDAWTTVIDAASKVLVAALGTGGVWGVIRLARGGRPSEDVATAPVEVTMPSGARVDTTGLAGDLARGIAELSTRVVEQGRRIDHLEARSDEQEAEILRQHKVIDTLTRTVQRWRSWAHDLVVQWPIVRQSETPPTLPEE